MERNIQNTQNLDNIIFYSGSYSIDAATYTAGREYGAQVYGLGTLSKTPTGLTYWSSFPDVLYKERDVILNSIGDLYNEALSYMSTTEDGIIASNSYIKNNRYNAIYTYETDLNNSFGFASIYTKKDLKNFLLSLNEQVFNKSAFYGDNIEVSSIKIDQTYFNWYPKNTIAYKETIDASYVLTYTSYFVNDNEYNSIPIPTENVSEELQEIINSMEEGQYLHTYSYDYTVAYFYDVPYIIGGDYYSYVRKTYNTIDDALQQKINEDLDDFEERYNHQEDIYAYYMYDCNVELQMLLSTLNVGVKQSTFKIGFDSLFNNWFGNAINFKVNLNDENGSMDNIFNNGIPDIENVDFVPKYNIANITSGEDGAIFAVFSDKINRITGNNVRVNKNVTHSFVSNSELTNENVVNILTPYSIDTLDLSPVNTGIDKILDLTETGWINRGCIMKSFILGNENTTDSTVEKIFGLNDIKTLEYIDLTNINSFKMTPAIDKLENLKVFLANGSNIESFRPKPGIELFKVDLPETIKSLKLIRNSFVDGVLTVQGEEKEFNGKLNYTPNSTLQNLTLVNVDNKLSYDLVKDWYTILNNENKLDSVIYLELQGINWTNVPVDILTGIKHFDINPNLSGNVSILGNGNYHWLSRKDFQDIKKLYGYNALIEGTVNNKVFKHLNIYAKSNKETFEFSLKVKNKFVESRNAYIDETGAPDRKYSDTLDVQFKDYEWDLNNNDYLLVGDPYNNRAANSILDLIYIDGKTSFDFIVDPLDGYAYCKLDKSIDTSDSKEVKSINVGDIVLFNSDTLMIYFKEDKSRTHYCIKLGNIIDIVEEVGINRYSALNNWFNTNETVTLEFIPSERENVIQEFIVDSLSEDENKLYDTNNDGINILIDIDDNAKANLSDIANTSYRIRYDENILSVEDITPDDQESIYPRKYNIKINPNFNIIGIKDTTFEVYSPVNEEDTLNVFNIQIIKMIHDSYVEDGILMLDANAFSVVDETLIIGANANPEFIEETNTLIIK